MPKENHRAGEVQEAGEIGGAPLIPRDESPRVLQPGKEPFDFPAALIAAEGTAILSEVDPVRPMGGDELDAARGQGLVEPIAVIGRVADEPRGIVGEEARVRVWSTSCVSCGDAEAMVMATGRPARSAMAMILVPLPRLVLPTQRPFFWRWQRSHR